MALSHLRKLQSDDSVYVAAIDRLDAAIRTELGRDQPGALSAVLDDYAQRYPRLAGLDGVREDLRQYTDVLNETLARHLTPLLALLKKVKFTTPPFQAQFRQLAATRLPSADVIRQHDAALSAWQRGDSQQALAGLQAISGGAWSRRDRGRTGAQEIDRRSIRGVAEESGRQGLRGTSTVVLCRTRSGRGRVVRTRHPAGSGRVARQGTGARARPVGAGAVAVASISRERVHRRHAALEAGISDRFRNQARLLSDAQTSAQQGMRIYSQLKAEHPEQWDQLQEGHRCGKRTATPFARGIAHGTRAEPVKGQARIDRRRTR